MSYYAEFDRVFIRSVCGYTPLWLLGDSSVTEGARPEYQDVPPVVSLSELDWRH